MKMNIVFWNSDVHSKISYLLIWYWVKQFLFEWRHKWTLHFEHFQYVFPEHCSFLHLVLFTADTNIGQWSNPSYLKSFGTLDADSRAFFRGGSFSSSLRLSLEIELVEHSCICWITGLSNKNFAISNLTVMTECPLHGTFPSWCHNVSVGQLEYCGILSFDNLIICLAISFERTRFFPAFLEKQ